MGLFEIIVSTLGIFLSSFMLILSTSFIIYKVRKSKSIFNEDLAENGLEFVSSDVGRGVNNKNETGLEHEVIPVITANRYRPMK